MYPQDRCKRILGKTHVFRLEDAAPRPGHSGCSAAKQRFGEGCSQTGAWEQRKIARRINFPRSKASASEPGIAAD